MKKVENYFYKVAVPFVTIFMITCIPVWYGMIGFAFDCRSVAVGVLKFVEFCFTWVVAVCLRERLIELTKTEEDA